jgi:hypothetical protein
MYRKYLQGASVVDKLITRQFKRDTYIHFSVNVNINNFVKFCTHLKLN